MTVSKPKSTGKNLTEPPVSVFFNASVILAGIKSPKGASGILLKFGASGDLQAYASVLVIQEVFRHTGKLGLTTRQTLKTIQATFPLNQIAPLPTKRHVDLWIGQVKDPGDAHVLAACQTTTAHYLVTLDKKHLLSLAHAVKPFQIVSPSKLLGQIHLYRTL